MSLEEFETLVTHIQAFPEYKYIEEKDGEYKSCSHTLFTTEAKALKIAEKFNLSLRPDPWLNLGVGKDSDWIYDEKTGDLIEWQSHCVTIGGYGVTEAQNV